MLGQKQAERGTIAIMTRDRRGLGVIKIKIKEK